uniref:Membrane transporter protein n=1 Tax=Panagrolaimus sp. PS1159 TaxID=55785 RepID=A0AC35FNK2_9BILA
MSIIIENPELNKLNPKKRTPKEFLQKYFLHGQQLTDEQEIHFVSSNAESFDAILMQKYRKIFAFLIPFVVAQFAWWCTAIRYDYLSLYETHWQLPVTMIGGAIVAGMTAEGGGAVAFPVMTFILHLTPKCARDFSLMIQSVGMSLALFVIIFMRIQIEWRAITYSLMGALPGVVFGFHMIDGLFDAPEKKMLFVSIWAAFAISLYILNREKKRTTVPVIQFFCLWKAVALMGTGFIGGIFTSFAGSVPVAVSFAPFGAFLGSHFHRLTLAWLVCILEFVAYFGFLCTFPPWPLLVASVAILFAGFIFFSFLSRAGKRLTEDELGIIDPHAIVPCKTDDAIVCK